jgi:NTE family protein
VEIGLVLPGGGARGAYEVGALSVLLPALEARGERVTIVCGTSVGGINAAFAGAPPHCHRRAAARLLDRWREVRKGSVIAGDRRRDRDRTAAAGGEVLELPGCARRRCWTGPAGAQP